MRILITGHQGYVGPAVIARLKADGHHLVGLDAGYFVDCLNPGTRAPQPDRDIRRDMRDIGPDDVAGIEAVVHLAGLSNDPLGQLVPDLTTDINHHATIRLARLVREAGASRFVFASSCSLYGASGDAAAPLDETAPLRPVSAYAVSKVACEHDLSELADDRFAPVFLRFATAFGASPRMRFDLVLNNLTAWARTTGTIRVMSDGTPWRPLVHVSDMAQAIACAVVAPHGAVAARPFNIGHPDNNLQVRDLAEIVRVQVPGSRVLITGETGGDPRSYQVDFTRALTELPGFVPQWTVRGLGIGAEGFETPRYVRLKRLRQLLEDGSLDQALRWPTK
jgi:nucleoside-diphosphate-sugar epimerase